MPPASASSDGGGDAQRTIRRRDNSSTAACGYVTFVVSNVLLVIYPLWALLPHHIVAQIDEHYTTFYPPRELAVYIPTYLTLLFVFVPIMYKGLNMRASHAENSIDGIWDTRSHACHEKTRCDNSRGSYDALDSLPAICDEDVRSVNLRIRQRIDTQTVDG